MWRQAVLVFILLVLPAPHAMALEVTPFFTRNQAPLMQVFGLPAAEGGALVSPSRTEARLTLDAANIFTGEENAVEELRLDGELYRLTLALRYGFSERLEIGLDLPYVWHSGGELDHVINGFHRTFDLPEGGRENWRDDRIGYLSIRDGQTRFRIDEPQDGVGDIVIGAGIKLFREVGPGGARSLSLRSTLKLPTGESEKLTGSGSTDLSLRLTGTDGMTLSAWGVTWYGTVGALGMTEGEVLPDLQRNLVGFGNLGLGWTPFSWVVLKIQLDGHTPFYDGSGLHHLDDPSLQVTYGLTFPLPGDVVCDLGMSEDVFVETAPDVSFQLALWRRF